MNNFFYGEVPLYIFFGICLTAIFFLLSFIVGYRKGFNKGIKFIHDELKKDNEYER